MSVSPISPHSPPQQSLDLHSGANFGNHEVKNISKGVKGVVEKAQHEVGKLQSHWNEMEEKEKSYYKAAAACAIIAILIILFITNLFGGILALGMAMQYAAVPWMGAIYFAAKAAGKTHERRPWEMPPFSKRVKGNKEAEKDWKFLWSERNQAKRELINVNQRLAYKKRMKFDYSQEESYAKFFLKKYEDAEVLFWKFANPDKAHDKMDKFNAARKKRHEPQLLT